MTSGEPAPSPKVRELRPHQSHGLLSRRISRFALESRSRFDDAKLDDGVQRLMWAILKETLRCYQSYIDVRTIHEQRRFREADLWIRSHDLSWIFSFESICGVLGIDSDYLRSEIVRWGRKHRAQREGEGEARVSA